MNYLETKIEFQNNKKQKFNEFILTNKIPLSINGISLSEKQTFKIYSTYEKLIINFQNNVQLQLNSQLLLITKQPQDWLVQMSQFLFLKKQ